MSFYQPLILRLEVKKGSRQISFSESSKLDIEQSPSTIERNRRRIMSGLKKRSPPTGASTRNDGTDDAPIAPTTTDKHVLHELPQQSTNFRGRRTYSEVVVESLDGDRCADVISCTSDAEVFPQSSRSSKAGSEILQAPDHVTYYYGNPFVEKTEGILHFFKYNDDRMGREVQCRMLCMIGVPSQITLREILLFIGGSIQTIERIKVIRDSTPNEYMIILKFKSHNDAVVFYEEFNGIQFNSLEPNQCRLLFVDRIECASEDEVTALCAGSSVSSEAGSSNHLTELPTCAVCLERMDDSVVSILCNHTFHAGCLEQWTDTTCPVCRYIQTPELVAEQRCSICGQSSDLWICLICGNIGCGRYAEGHAYRHFELTSHTFCLQVGGQRVWDYAGDNYVHRLIQSDTEGKVVEYQRGDPEAEADEKKDKLDGIKLEYTCLLTSQLESQRMYFEARLADMERAMNNMEKMAQAQIDDLETKLTQSSSECKSLKKQLQEVSAAKQANEKKCLQTTSKLNKVTSELKEEREMNEMLRSDQQLWKHKVDELEKKCATCEQQFSQRINELQEQVSDLMLHFDAQSKIQAQLDSAQVSKEEIESSHVDVSMSTPEKKQRRKNKR
ncbi:hypothetical protein Y032_0214g2340 [Ancylostoma ceylanicum]|uniref:Zinc finger, C3HC4 type n=1 Tax=Ancylostoma ceylanicum TaxID=53326 RepID=A0A016SJC4_9BILA|nr:hypothetical protein Y032_0214g2340 [Ancylostoma ceylanicum]